MGTGPSIRRLRGARIRISELARQVPAGTPRALLRSKVAVGRAVRTGWLTFEAAPKVDGFELLTETRSRVPTITPPRRSGKPGGASIHVPEGEWSVEEQLREERDRSL